MKCPRCHESKVEYHPSFGVIPCKNCRQKDVKIKEHPEFSTLSMQERITKQREKHEKDLLQPWGENQKINPDYAKAYPEESEETFSKDELESL